MTHSLQQFIFWGFASYEIPTFVAKSLTRQNVEAHFIVQHAPDAQINKLADEVNSKHIATPSSDYKSLKSLLHGRNTSQGSVLILDLWPSIFEHRSLEILEHVLGMQAAHLNLILLYPSIPENPLNNTDPILDRIRTVHEVTLNYDRPTARFVSLPRSDYLASARSSQTLSPLAFGALRFAPFGLGRSGHWRIIHFKNVAESITSYILSGKFEDFEQKHTQVDASLHPNTQAKFLLPCPWNKWAPTKPRVAKYLVENF